MLKLQVSGMTCGGCAVAIERALRAVVPGAKVDVDVRKGIVAVAAQSAQQDTVTAAIEDAGFIVTGAAA
jgi:copper chaperone